jgi:hypothetical protein
MAVVPFDMEQQAKRKKNFWTTYHRDKNVVCLTPRLPPNAEQLDPTQTRSPTRSIVPIRTLKYQAMAD